MEIKLHYLGYKVIENAPFAIDRPDGSYRYIFFHFISPVKVTIDGEEIEAPPGSCILYTPRHPQKFEVIDNRLSHSYLDFTISSEKFFEDVRIPLNTVFQSKQNDFISKTILGIQNEFVGSKIGSNHLVGSYIISFFVNLSRGMHSHSSGHNAAAIDALKTQFEELRLRMYERPDGFTVTNMAKELSFSPSYFSNLYREFFNVSPMDDLTEARKIRAINLLKQGENVSEIYAIIGFNSPEYFYRWFKKQFGTSPNKYLKEMENGD